MSDVTDVNVGAAADRQRSPEPVPPLPLWRRRRLRVAAAVVSLAPVAAAVWWLWSVTSHPELRFGMFNRVNRVENDVTGAEGGIIEKRNLLGTQVDIVFVPDQRVYVYIGIYNDGRHPLRIEAAPVAGYYYFGFDGMEVSPERHIGIGQLTTFESFKPFTLEAGESRNVRLNFRLAGCEPDELQRGTTSIDGVRVRYRILGVERSVHVAFEESVLAVPASGPCERPILDPFIARPLERSQRP